MKKMYALLAISSTVLLYAQVGINTTDPQSTLDVNGNVIIRTVDPATVSSAYDFLVHDNATNEVHKINGNLAPVTAEKTISKGVERNGVSLLSGSLFAGWRKINFASANIPINQGANFDAATDFYTIPSTGVYEINYQFKYGSGVLASLLNFGGVPSIGILRHPTSGPYNVLDSRKFSGVSVPLALSLIVSETSIDSVYQLTAGDRLSFELNSGGLSLGLLSSSHAEFVIKKISN